MHCHKPHPKPDNMTCADIEKKAKAMFEEIEKNKNLTKEQKAAKEKWVKEWFAKESHAHHCKPPHPHPEDVCKKIADWCHATYNKIENDKKLSKDEKAKKEAALKEKCMKKSKAAKCKPCPRTQATAE